MNTADTCTRWRALGVDCIGPGTLRVFAVVVLECEEKGSATLRGVCERLGTGTNPHWPQVAIERLVAFGLLRRAGKYCAGVAPAAGLEWVPA